MAPTDIPIDQLLQKDIELDLTESRGPMMKWSGVGMTIAVVVIVTLRMISRAFLLKRVYKDDYCILISTVSTRISGRGWRPEMGGMDEMMS